MTNSDIFLLAQPVIGFGALALGGGLFLRLMIRQSNQRKAKRADHRHSSVMVLDEAIETVQLKSNRGVFVFGLTEFRSAGGPTGPAQDPEVAVANPPGTGGDRRS